MVLSALKKSKVTLSDYDYKSDIKNRLTMATLSIFEVEVLEEILHGSINLPIKKLTSHFHTKEESIISVLEKFSKMGLLKIKPDSTIAVNKKMRKYYESQYEKFDDNFNPNMEFLKKILKKIPIHILPSWYSINRASDNIFNSIIEKHLISPKIYERYLMETNFQTPLIKKIMKDVFESKNFKVQSDVIRRKYSLTKEECEEVILLLEFNFICCLSYNRVGKEWKEVITPFHEWKEFLKFLSESKPKPIRKTAKIKEKRHINFGFISDLCTMLKIISKTPTQLSSIKNNKYAFPESTIKMLAKKCSSMSIPTKNNIEEYNDYFHKLTEKLICLKFVKLDKDNNLIYSKTAEKFLKMKNEERVMLLRRNNKCCLTNKPKYQGKYTKRDMHAIKKSLNKISNGKWFYFDDFIKSLIIPIGKTKPVTLKKTGRHWKYEPPKYSQQDVEFIKEVIFIRLFELGITTIGEFKKQSCFALTPFGISLLGM